MEQYHFKGVQEFVDKIQLTDQVIINDLMLVNVCDIPDWVANRLERYRNEFYELNIIRNQTHFQFAIDGKQYRSDGSPYVCCVSPNQLQSYDVLGDDDTEGYMLYFSKKSYQQLQQAGIPLDVFKHQYESYYELSPKAYEQLLHWVLLLEQNLKHTSTHQLAISQQLLGVLLLEVANILPTKQAKFSSRPKEIIDFFFRSLNQFKRYETVGFYAEKMALTARQLNEMTKKVLGKTALKVIQEFIIEQAQTLLLQSNWTITEVAYHLGFKELSNFSRLFKRILTTSPQQFRATGIN